MKRLIFSILLLLPGFMAFNQTINCLDCHENLINKSAHDKVIGCGDCHNDINKDEHTKGSAQKVDCKKCHAALDAQMQNDVHRKLMHLEKSKAPDCKSCHGSHGIQKTQKIADKEKVFCGKCHKKGIMVVPYHTILKKANDCSKCHSDTRHKTELQNSVHSNLSCTNCHSYVINNFETHQKAPKEGVLADCYLCHASIAQEHKESIHGLSITAGIHEAAQCWNCHGSHNITKVKDGQSKVHPKNLAKTCGTCHDDTLFIKKYELSVNKPGKMYNQSVHGKLVMEGKSQSATCITCHGKHDIKNRVMPESKIAATNIPNTCEKCHKEITDDYKASIHWIAVKKGIRSAPSCNDCHSEHNIHAINTANKREEMRKIQENTCLQCHQNLLISQRYHVEGQNVKNYQDSYHGLAAAHGDKKAALCVDCHNVHKILPRDHQGSSISKNNNLKTCKKCHTDATETFANSYSHTTQTSSAAKIENIVKTIYIWLILVVIGGMLLHNLLIFVHEMRCRYNKSKNEIKIPRFTSSELIQHSILLTSFIILAMTGFQLKFPESAYGKLLYSLGFNEVIRQWVHRISAIVMIGLSLYHSVYLIFTARGRDVLKGLLPGMSDIRQMKDTVLFYLHISKKHPQYANYNYIEKMEYWALIWGTIVMGLTGFVLWFPTIVGNWAPVWFIKVSEIIHFYEAILATLAILVWHWFFVIFHPKQYPVSFTVINGKISLDHFKEEHSLTFKKIVQEYSEVKKGTRPAHKMSHYSKLFIQSIEKQGYKIEEVLKDEDLE